MFTTCYEWELTKFQHVDVIYFCLFFMLMMQSSSMDVPDDESFLRCGICEKKQFDLDLV
jgi:hypothetical protein